MLSEKLQQELGRAVCDRIREHLAELDVLVPVGSTYRDAETTIQEVRERSARLSRHYKNLMKDFDGSK
jgi:predicted house-cleaning noncanonical NTP pyrophosphatase (MazG superfamily)